MEDRPKPRKTVGMEDHGRRQTIQPQLITHKQM